MSGGILNWPGETNSVIDVESATYKIHLTVPTYAILSLKNHRPHVQKISSDSNLCSASYYVEED